MCKVPTWFISTRQVITPAIDTSSSKNNLTCGFGEHHFVQKAGTADQLTEATILRILSGSGKFNTAITELHHNANAYTSVNFYNIYHRLWQSLTVTLNPTNLYPIPPYVSHAWYEHFQSHSNIDSTNDLLLSILTMNFDYYPISTRRNGARIMHFVTKNYPGCPTTPPGYSPSWQGHLDCLRGMAAVYGALLHPAYGEAFRFIAQQIEDLQLGIHLSPIFLESKTCRVLANIHYHIRNMHTPFRADNANESDAFLTMYSATPTQIASIIKSNLLHTHTSTSLWEEEQQFTRQQGTLGVPSLSTMGLLITNKHKSSTTPSNKDISSSDVSPTRTTGFRFCMQNLLHKYGISDGSAPFTACNDTNCKDLHHSGSIYKIPIQLLRRAARGDPLTANESIRNALLAAAAIDPKFYDVDNQ